MGVEAARLALAVGARRHRVDALLVRHRRSPPTSTRPTPPPIHAALRLDPTSRPPSTSAAPCARRSARCAPALDGGATPCSWSPATSAPACPAAPTRRRGGDGAAALLVGATTTAPVVAELLGTAVGHRGVPRPLAHAGRAAARRCGRSASARPSYVPLGEQAWNAALRRRRPRRPTRSTAAASSTGTHARVARSVGGQARTATARGRRPLAATVGNTGAAQPGLLLAAAARAGRAGPGHRAGRAGRRRRRARCSAPPTRSPRTGPPARCATQVAAGAPLPYGKFLAWRGMLTGRAAAPARAGAGVGVGRRAAARTGSSASSARGSATPEPCTCRPRVLARRRCAPTTWSRRRWPTSQGTDRHLHRSTASPTRRARRSCSPSSTSTAAAASRSSSPTSTPTRSRSGDRVEMTFRRLFTADGIHNYFWKADRCGGSAMA